MSEVEMFDVFNEEMIRIGVDSRENVHANGLWHQTFHCWIINQSTSGGSSLLFQLRHKDKDTYPGLLDVSSAGHLQAGEGVKDGVRELAEELGITVEFSDLVPCGMVAEENYISENCMDREFNHIFIHECERLLEEYTFQVSEISGLFYINVREFKELLNGDINVILTDGIILDEVIQNVRSVRRGFTIHDFTPMSAKYKQVLFNSLDRMPFKVVDDLVSTQIKLIKDYKHMEEYRLSFNQLANRIFGIDFESWYQRGCWNERYICYSFIHNDKVVANLSVNLMDIIHNQQVYQAIQIGTVMTDPDFRNQGLSRKLMDIVIEEYRTKCSFMYLYANNSVLNFYTKFGFVKAIEPNFSFDLATTLTGVSTIKKLNIHSYEDWNLIRELYSFRKPISSQYGVVHAEGIFTWYCLNIFSDDIYYLEDLHIIIIYQQEGQLLHLYDIVSTTDVSIIELVGRLPLKAVSKVIVHYHPDDQLSFDKKSYVEPTDTLFILPINKEILSDMKFPKIAQA